MNEKVNAKVAEYEEHLRAAERDIEKACQAICPLCGSDINSVRESMFTALDIIQERIQKTWRLYDNPEIEIER